MPNITDLIRVNGNVVKENGPGAHQRCFVCIVNGVDLPETLQGDYARLFAAAPALLEACQAAAIQLEEPQARITHGEAQALRERLRAALAKATGSESTSIRGA